MRAVDSEDDGADFFGEWRLPHNFCLSGGECQFSPIVNKMGPLEKPPPSPSCLAAASEVMVAV